MINYIDQLKKKKTVKHSSTSQPTIPAGGKFKTQKGKLLPDWK